MATTFTTAMAIRWTTIGTARTSRNDRRGRQQWDRVTGVAWQTTLLPVKFLDENNAGSTDDAVAAINYLVMLKSTGKANVRVVNNSWGTTEYKQSLYDAISRANAADILFVCAAGNGDAWATESISINRIRTSIRPRWISPISSASRPLILTITWRRSATTEQLKSISPRLAWGF